MNDTKVYCKHLLLKSINLATLSTLQRYVSVFVEVVDKRVKLLKKSCEVQAGAWVNIPAGGHHLGILHSSMFTLTAMYG